MIAAQLDITIQEALLRLRARSYAEGLSVATVATAVVDRTLRFGGDTP